MPSGSSLIVGSPPLNGREKQVELKLAYDPSPDPNEEELKVAVALVRKETSEALLRADCLTSIKVFTDIPFLGMSQDETLLLALKSCLLIRRLPGRRVRSDVLPRGTPGPRSPARVTCVRSASGLAIRIASRSEDTPLREIVGDRLRIGLVRPPSAEGDGQFRIAFGRR